MSPAGPKSLRVTSRASQCFGPEERSLSKPVPPPPSQSALDWSPPPPAKRGESKSESGEEKPAATSTVGQPDLPCSPGRLHSAVWLGDLILVDELLRGSADVNLEDSHGVTPVMLAVELLPRSAEYVGVVQHLLSKHANPRLRSGSGWSPLDEAVSRGDGRLVKILFEAAQRDLQQRWDTRLASVARSLELLPDFECRIRWEFESPVVPLLNRIAPSDVLHVRKRGNSLRLDSTLASWKKYRLSKRRRLTTLFRGARGESGNAAGSGLFMINHDKQTVVDVTEGLDPEEAAAVVEDLAKADALQWDMSVDSLDVAEGTTWLGNAVGKCDVNGWACFRYDIRGELGMSIRKKGCRIEGMTFQDYFGYALPADACLPEMRQEFAGRNNASSRVERAPVDNTFTFGDDGASESGSSIASEVLEAWPEEHQPLPPAAAAASPGPAAAAEPASRPGKIATRDKLGKSSHRVSGSVWLATDFAISMERFLPVMEALAMEHDAMRRLKEILESTSLQEAARRARLSAEQAGQSQGASQDYKHVFPVRASIPVNLAIRAVVVFESFELLDASQLESNLFEVPAGYRTVSRREAQKTPSRAKKRMLVANLAL
eukprot:TRINITY_DN35565_c0_g1_i1.p1 TRINITY_DN35565_c0_g1~~TRINITY_DN35565_c0_g1_i1.p1  ORF type:complete len:603 (-),score=104.69 TRINITY_DN35565_c0_g1_i1:45-1853(-)